MLYCRQLLSLDGVFGLAGSFSFTARLSRKSHLWLGIVFTPLLLLFALSGIGLNHPQWFKSVSIPLHWMPHNYAYANWNRGLIEAIIPDGRGGYYATGKEGVWQLQGERAVQLSNPLQTSAWQRMGYSLYLDQANQQLLHGARDGLYSLDLETANWQQVAGSAGEHFVSILAAGEQLLAVSRNRLFRLDFQQGLYQLSAQPLRLADNAQNSPLFRFIFQLHSGELLGVVGVFLMDAVAGLLIFLCLTALYLFLFPRLVKHKWLSRRQRIRGSRGFHWMLRQHNRWGLIIAVVLLISGLTGMVMRPPGLLLIASAQGPVKLRDNPHSPLPHIIEQAVWHQQSGNLMLLTSGGLYLGKPGQPQPFVTAPLSVPVHAMGATLFLPYQQGYLIGSFSGIYAWQAETDAAQAVLLDTGRPRMMPKAALTVDDDLAVFDFYTGLNLQSGAAGALPQMPQAINQQASISLWHLLFEIHNMRVFQAYIGPFYLLLVALSGLALVLISVSGVYDYWRKSRRGRR